MAASRETEADYNIEKILDERYNAKKKVTEYFVKWEGYPHSENTWETRADIMADGYEAAMLAYDGTKKVSQSQESKKGSATKTPRNARSKTPVKRHVKAASDTASDTARKLDYTSDEAESTTAQGSEVTGSSLKSLVYASMIMVIAVAIGREDDTFNFPYGNTVADVVPPICGLILVRLLGKNVDLTSESSLTLLWMIFSRILLDNRFASYTYLQDISEIVWRAFLARAVGVTLGNGNILVFATLTWFTAADVMSSINLEKLSLFFSIWATITTIDRWTEYRSTLNFFDALASCASIAACFVDDSKLVWASATPLVLSAVARVVRHV